MGILVEQEIKMQLKDLGLMLLSTILSLMPLTFSGSSATYFP